MQSHQRVRLSESPGGTSLRVAGAALSSTRYTPDPPGGDFDMLPEQQPCG